MPQLRRCLQYIHTARNFTDDDMHARTHAHAQARTRNEASVYPVTTTHVPYTRTICMLEPICVYIYLRTYTYVPDLVIIDTLPDTYVHYVPFIG